MLNERNANEGNSNSKPAINDKQRKLGVNVLESMETEAYSVDNFDQLMKLLKTSNEIE